MTAPDQPLRVESLCDPGQGGVAARRAGLPVEVQQLHLDVMRAFLATGGAPHRDDLPLPSGIGRERAFVRLAGVDLVHLDAAGRVVVAYPFSAGPTGHTVQLDGGPVLDTMCAIDALGIPLMTGQDGVIESADPSDGHPVRVERRGALWRWAPADTVVLVAQTSGRGPAVECLCPAITFHTSRRSAENHLDRWGELTGVVLDQARALEVAGRSFGALLSRRSRVRPSGRGRRTC